MHENNPQNLPIIHDLEKRNEIILEQAKTEYITSKDKPTYADIAKLFKIPLNIVQKAAHSDNWLKQRKTFWAQACERARSDLIETATDELREMQLRQVSNYKKLQQIGIEALTEEKIIECECGKLHKVPRLRVATASEATSMIDTGIKGERLIRGQPTQRIEIRTVQIVLNEVTVRLGRVLKQMIDQGKITPDDAKEIVVYLSHDISESPIEVK